jgi:hypothetical protein
MGGQLRRSASVLARRRRVRLASNSQQNANVTFDQVISENREALRRLAPPHPDRLSPLADVRKFRDPLIH